MTVPDGMVYVGTTFGGNALYEQNGGLINPSLSVVSGTPNAMAYWPSYATISPQNRAAYLRWLSTGKSNPDADIGYVFLYFYGIERRLIVERPSEDEARALIAELNRLLSIYGENRSFRGYATRLITTARFLYLGESGSGEPDPLTDEFTIDREATLATFCRDGKPISFAWVALWYKELFEHHGAWQVCPSDFLARAKRIFDTAYPNGFIYKPSDGRRFECAYNAAGRSIVASFDDIITARYGTDLPYIGGDVPGDIALCFKQAAGQLARYANFVLAHKGAQNSPVALACLPADLKKARLPDAEAAFHRWVGELLETARGIVVLENLWGRLYGEACWAFDTSSWEELAGRLQQFGYGLVPDPLYNEIPHLRLDQPVVLYRLGDAPRAKPLDDFVAGQAIAFVCAEYARIAEAQLSQQIIRRLSQALQTLPMAAAERERILASLPWCETQGQIRGRLKKTLSKLPPPRRSIVLSLAAAVLNGAEIDRVKLVRCLEKVAVMLSVDRKDVYATLHHADAVVPTLDPEDFAPENPYLATGPTGFAIPQPPHTTRSSDPRRTGTDALDLSRVKAVIADTQQVSKALDGVFLDDEPAQPIPSVDRTEDGLTPSLSRLLKQLLERPSWSRAEFESLTRPLALMPDGALEALNDWAFDRFDEALIDDGDPLVLNSTCVDALSTDGAALASA